MTWPRTHRRGGPQGRRKTKKSPPRRQASIARGRTKAFRAAPGRGAPRYQWLCALSGIARPTDLRALKNKVLQLEQTEFEGPPGMIAMRQPAVRYTQPLSNAHSIGGISFERSGVDTPFSTQYGRPRRVVAVAGRDGFSAMAK